MRRCSIGIVGSAVAALLALAASPSAVARDLVVLLRPGAVDITVISGDLESRDLPLSAELWRDDYVAARLAESSGTISTGDLYDAIDSVRAQTGVVAAGELISQRGDRLTFYSGRALITFGDATDLDAAGLWGRAHGHELVEAAEGQNQFLFEAHLPPLDVISMAAGFLPWSNVVEFEPIAFVAEPSGTRAWPGAGVYHRIPPARNFLAVVMAQGFDQTEFDDWVHDHVGTALGEPTDIVQIVRFLDENQMMQAQADLGSIDALRGGPLLSREPLAFLTNQIAVRFPAPAGPYLAGSLLASHGLVEVRRLPYSNGTRLYAAATPSYGLYDAARELIVQGLVEFAVPNIVTIHREACGGTSCLAPHQGYLGTLDACDAWDQASSRWYKAKLGVLDFGGVHDVWDACDEVDVHMAIDLASMETCPATAGSWCTAECNSVWSGWSNDHGTLVALTAAANHDSTDTREIHGLAPRASLIAARLPNELLSNTDPTVPDDDLWTDIAFADSLWWLAGGNPNWCRDSQNYDCTTSYPAWMPLTGCAPPGSALTYYPCSEPQLPDPLSSTERADVINMSFTREDFLVHDCPDAGICQIVCAGTLGTCGVIDAVLDRIRDPQPLDGVRDGGAVVVAAVGEHGTVCDTAPCAPDGESLESVCYDSGGNVEYRDVYADLRNAVEPHTDLAESDGTIAVGSVLATGEPFENVVMSGLHCLIQFTGDFVDVMAPMGSEGDKTALGSASSPPRFGASSAAAAAVSGVAALMIEQNTDLSAAQVECILQQTADKQYESGEMWDGSAVGNWKVPDCQLSPTEPHSPCLGYGMVNACQAVQAARACSLLTLGGTVRFNSEEGLRLPSKAESGLVGPGVNFVSPHCPCNEDGSIREPGIEFDPIMISIHRPLPEMVLELLECVIRRDCPCWPLPDCFRLDFLNPSEELQRDVQIQMCFDKDCWDMGAPISVWNPGEQVRVPLPVDRKIVELWRKTGHAPTTRILRGVGATKKSAD